MWPRACGFYQLLRLPLKARDQLSEGHDDCLGCLLMPGLQVSLMRSALLGRLPLNRRLHQHRDRLVAAHLPEPVQPSGTVEVTTSSAASNIHVSRAADTATVTLECVAGG